MFIPSLKYPYPYGTLATTPPPAARVSSWTIAAVPVERYREDRSGLRSGQRLDERTVTRAKVSASGSACSSIPNGREGRRASRLSLSNPDETLMVREQASANNKASLSFLAAVLLTDELRFFLFLNHCVPAS